jgi:cell division protein ZipA
MLRMTIPMMSELRWALLILGVVFIALLAWWERRRPRQASGAFERALSREGGADAPPRRVREPPLTLPEVYVREPVAARELPVVESTRESPEELEELPEPAQLPEPAELAEPPELAELLERRASPVAAAAARAFEAAERQGAAELEDTAQLEHAAELEDAVELEHALAARGDESTVEDRNPAAPPVAPLLREALPQLPASEPLRVDWPAEHERRILTLRLVAPQHERFAGRSLRQALAAEGFLLGQFAIFHKPDDEHRAVLSAASLTRPGTFDMETMDSQHYGGLSLFAVLPGPKSPPQAFDELVFAARNLNDRLHGVLQDEQGTPLTPARVAQLREQLRARS